MTDPQPETGVRFVTPGTLAALSARARQSPRRRLNHNFHAGDDAVCHRLLNAVEPDAYIPPHRHLDARKDETLVVLAGRLGLLLFDAAGRVTGRGIFTPGGPFIMVDIPHGTFHTWLSLAPGSVFFEAKAGPFVPLTPEERAPWAPAEGDPAVPAYLAGLRGLLAGPADGRRD